MFSALVRGTAQRCGGRLQSRLELHRDAHHRAPQTNHPSSTSLFNFSQTDTNKLFEQYDVQKQIDVLHGVVTEARARRQRGETPGADRWREDLQPREAVRARTIPTLVRERDMLRARLAQVRCSLKKLLQIFLNILVVQMEQENMELCGQVQENVAAQDLADTKTAEIFGFFDEVRGEPTLCPSLAVCSRTEWSAGSDLREMAGTATRRRANVDAFDGRDPKRYQPSSMMTCMKFILFYLRDLLECLYYWYAYEAAYLSPYINITMLAMCAYYIHSARWGLTLDWPQYCCARTSCESRGSGGTLPEGALARVGNVAVEQHGGRAVPE